MTDNERGKLKVGIAACAAKLKDGVAKLKIGVTRLLSNAESAIFPEDITCDICGDELIAPTRYRLCAGCLSALPYVGEHICLCCGVALTDEADYCNRCEKNDYKFRICRAPLIYEGAAKDAIYKLKFGGRKYIAVTLGALMADEYLKQAMDGEIATFVPMTAGEEKKRGYNQSELLAREVAGRLGLPLLPALIKIKDTSAQKRLTGNERADNIKGAFKCIFSEIKGRKVLLIDDVFTTGATADECADALLKAGARSVSVLVAAVTKQKIPAENAEGAGLL